MRSKLGTKLRAILAVLLMIGYENEFNRKKEDMKKRKMLEDSEERKKMEEINVIRIEKKVKEADEKKTIRSTVK